MTGARTSQSRAFTLIEMTVSLSVLTIIMLSLGSVVMIAARSIPNPSEGIQAELELARLSSNLERDLQYASKVQITLTSAPKVLEVDLGLLDIRVGTELVQVARGTMDVVTDAQFEQMRIQVPAGNDGLSELEVLYAYDHDAETMKRTVQGESRDAEDFRVQITSFGYENVSETGRSIHIDLQDPGSTTHKQLSIEFYNEPRFIAS